MDSTCRRIFVFVCLLSASCFPLIGASWTQPTPDELKMTSDPAAPDAPAVYLFREEIVNDKMHSHTTYARIKILTEKGKEQFSEIEIPLPEGCEWGKYLQRGRAHHRAGWNHRSVHRQTF